MNEIKVLDKLNFLDLVDQHKQLFPQADLNGQILKLDEELNEYLKATTEEEKIQELADCIICCIGIYRWATLVSRSYMAMIFNKKQDKIKEIINEVARKWEINLNRTWEYKDGKYHHI